MKCRMTVGPSSSERGGKHAGAMRDKSNKRLVEVLKGMINGQTPIGRQTHSGLGRANV